MRKATLLLATPYLLATSTAFAATLTVGPSGTYSAPCAAIAAAKDGDTIEIDAGGTYSGDVCAIPTNNLTLRGTNGRAHVAAGGKNSGGKGIWVVQGSNITVENIELSGCTVPDQNGAGIRWEGKSLTVRNSYFHDNENGILGGNSADSTILIENSEFANNGFGDGQSHNMYIGAVASFTLRGSYSHHAKIGHLVKSRALKNIIVYNRITGEDGTDSYEIDLPQGGLSLVMGNLIQQGPKTDNSSILAYSEENQNNPDRHLYVINNTFVNDRGSGTFLNLHASAIAMLRNNIFTGGGTITNLTSADKAGNFETGDPMLVDRAKFDYQLLAASPCVNTAVNLVDATDFPLTPDAQYVHPASMQGRSTVGVIDIGAYELNGGGGAAGSSTGGSAGSSTGGSAGSSTGGSAGSSTGGSAGSSTGGSAGTAGSGIVGSTADDSGCGCRTSSRSSVSGSILALLAAVALILRRRR